MPEHGDLSPSTHQNIISIQSNCSQPGHRLKTEPCLKTDKVLRLHFPGLEPPAVLTCRLRYWLVAPAPAPRVRFEAVSCPSTTVNPAFTWPLRAQKIRVHSFRIEFGAVRAISPTSLPWAPSAWTWPWGGGGSGRFWRPSWRTPPGAPRRPALGWKRKTRMVSNKRKWANKW